MKKMTAVIVLILFSISMYGQASRLGRPVFSITYEEKGSNVNDSWQYNAFEKFSLSAYNMQLRGSGNSIQDNQIPLDLEPGAILRLKPGTKIKFYAIEVNESGSGQAGSYTRVLQSNGVETLTEKTQDEVRTKVTTDSDFRNEEGIPANQNFPLNARYYRMGCLSELTRTSDGAILHVMPCVGDNLGDWGVSDEITGQIFPEVETFVLSEEELTNWRMINKTNEKSASGDEMSLKVSIRLSMDVEEGEKPEINLYGCSELALGEQGEIIASGKPEGGEFKFWVEPDGMFTVESDGSSSAVIRGAKPGRGTFYAEYKSSDGKTVRASQSASCVKIESYNGGKPIPQIALYDIDGKKLTGIKEVSLSSQPADAYELVDFVSQDNSVLTAAGNEKSVELHGHNTGKTTLQAKTNCGSFTGPAVQIEVVNCNDETIAALERMKKAAIENLQDASRNLEKVFNSKDFEKARNEIVAATAELLAKAGLTIVTSGSAVNAAGKISGAVETASKIAEAGASISEMIASGSQKEFNANAIKAVIGELGGKVVSSSIGIIEVQQAAEKFGNHLAQIIRHENAMKDALERYEKADKDLKRIIGLQQICKGETGGPKTQDSPEPQPKPDEPVAKTKTPAAKKTKSGNDSPPVQEPKSGNDAPPSQEAAAEENPISPPPPEREPRQVGLPYSPSECGCDGSKELVADSRALSIMKTEMENLGKCVNDFTSGPLADYKKTLDDWSAITASLNKAVESGAAGFETAAKNAFPGINELIEKTKSYDREGKSFFETFQTCPKSMEKGVELINSMNKK